MKKRGVLSLWKTMLLLAAAFIAVVGGTVLILYLTGRGNEVVEPENFEIVKELVSGDGEYNSELGQLEVSSNFKIMLNTTTEGVTEDGVSLSLQGGWSEGDYVTDGVIRVKKRARFGKSIEIFLETERNPITYKDGIKGGNSVLIATSDNELMKDRTQKIKIAVDVPVEEGGININLNDNTSNSVRQEVVVGSTFKVNTSFVVEKSGYLFSDENRKKAVFYSPSLTNIEYGSAPNEFRAVSRSETPDRIVVYTFKNSYYQNLVMKKFEDIEDPFELNQKVAQELFNHEEYAISKTIEVVVKEIVPTEFNVQAITDNTNFKVLYDTYMDVTVSRTNDDTNKTLGASVFAGNERLNALLGNVGIKVQKVVGKTDVSIIGGRVVKVVHGADAAPVITLEDFNDKFDYSRATDAEYYILPTSAPKNPEDYFWKIGVGSNDTFASSTYTLGVNLFYVNEDGKLTNFVDFASEKSVKLTADDHNDNPPAWKTSSGSDAVEAISMTVTYDEKGTVIEDQKKLPELLNPISSNNNYKTVKYFAFVDAEDANAANLTDLYGYFGCAEGKKYTVDYKGQALNIDNTKSKEYFLFEIENSILTAKKSFAGNVKVVPVIVKTDLNNVPYVDEEGKYIFVATGWAREVTVESTLSIANMTTSFAFADTSIQKDAEGEFYIPAINKTELNEQKVMLKLSLRLETDNKAEDRLKIDNALLGGNLGVECVGKNGEKLDSYVHLAGLSLVEAESSETELVFNGNLQINEALFSNTDANAKGVYIALRLRYNDGTRTYTKAISGTSAANENVDHFYIYYQRATAVEAAYEKLGQVSADQTIVVKNKDNLEITWGTYPVAGENPLTALNDLLTYKILDQKGKEIDPINGLYDYKLVEVPTVGEAPAILFDAESNKKILGFAGANVNTKLKVQVVDSENNNVGIVSDVLNFEIQSEGVSSVEYASTDIPQTNVGEETYIEGSKTSGTVAKYVTTGDVIDLKNLIKVYTSTEKTEVTDLQFKLRSSYLTGLGKDKLEQLCSLVDFMSGEEVVAVENLGTKTISQMKFKFPFGKRANIEFVVTKSGSSLFEINLTFVCLPDIGAETSFVNYEKNYAGYLQKNTNAVSVFADESYDLKTYITLNSSERGKKYDWSMLDNVETNVSNLFVTSSKEICSLEKSVLKIASVYQYTAVTFTIYYGVQSQEYALSVTVSLYVNPNIVVVANEENPYIDLANISSATLSGNYTFHKFTAWLEKRTNASAVDTAISTTNFTYENTSANKFLTLDNAGFAFADGSALTIDLGQTVEQKFAIKYKEKESDPESSAIFVDAILVQQSGDKLVSSKLENISYKVGYGADTTDTINKVFGTSVSTKLYNGQTALFLTASTNYSLAWDSKTKTGFQISSVEGNFNKDASTGNTLSVSGLGNDLFISLDGNTFTVTTTLTQVNKLALNINMSAIISAIGEKFVKYGNENDGKDASILLGAPAELEKNAVFAEFDAGQTYQILQVVEDGTSVAGRGFVLLKAGLNGASVSIEIDNTAKGYIDGLARIVASGADFSLAINHLENNYSNAYIVLKMTLTKAESSSTEKPTFVYYYRIKVTPSFTNGAIRYPYAEDKEYLDQSHVGYKDGEYVVNMKERLTSENSKYTSGVRIEGPTYLDNVETPSEVTVKYYIDSVIMNKADISKESYSTYFDKLEIVGSQLHIKIKSEHANEKFTIVVGHKYYVVVDAESAENNFVAENLLIGSGEGLNYTFVINQSSTYTHSLVYDENTEDEIGGILLEDEDENHVIDNVYEIKLKADGKEKKLTSSIAVVENSTENDVSDYGVSIRGEADKVLKPYNYVIANGTKYKKAGDTSGALFTLEEDVTLETVLFDETNKNAQFTYRGEQISVSSRSVTPTYLNRNGNEVFFTLKDNISQDAAFDILYYTNQKVVMTLKVAVTSHFTITQNSNLTPVANGGLVVEGGKKYILSNIPVAATEGEAPVVSGLAAEGETSEETFESLFTITGKEGEVLKSFTISLDSTDPKNAELEKYIEIDEANGTIEFAHMSKDTTFKFVGTITANRGKEDYTYSFNFTITAKKSYDLDINRTFGAGDIYAQETRTITVEELYNSLYTHLPAQEGNSHIYFVTTVEGETKYMTSMSIQPENVGVDTTQEIIVSLAYVFGGTLADGVLTGGYVDADYLSLTISYTVKPNVELSTNYPNPTGEQVLDVEYLNVPTGNTITVKDFFKSKADFAADNRVVIDNAVKKNGKTVDVAEKMIGLKYSGLSGMLLKVGGTPYTGAAGTVGTEKIDQTYQISFILNDVSKNGEVTFEYIVNAVKIYYKVIVSTKVYSLDVTYAPNYGTSEELYLEDLAGAEEQNLFAPNRIMNFTFKSNVANNSKYYLVFGDEKTATNKIIPLTASSATVGRVENRDIGVSLVGYQYRGAYGSLADAQTGANKLEDADIFEVNPTLHGRIAVKYGDGSFIKDAGNLEVNETSRANKSITFTFVKTTDLNMMFRRYTYTLRFAESENEDANFVDVEISGFKTPGKHTVSVDADLTNYQTFAGVVVNGELKKYYKNKEDENYDSYVDEIFSEAPKVNTADQTIVKGVDFKLSGITNEDIGTEKELEISFNLNEGSSENEPINIGVYRIVFKTEIAVGGQITAADLEGESPTIRKAILQAGTKTSLLDNSVLDIRNTRRDARYSDIGYMQNSNGSIALRVYGLDDLKIGIDSTDAQVRNSLSYKLHDHLKENDFITGIIPNAITDGNADAKWTDGTTTANLLYNYISIQGDTLTGDYLLDAQGADNRGNHVLMKLEYTLQFGANTVTQSFDILFLVKPNSSVKIMSGPNGLMNAAIQKEFNDGHLEAANDETNPFTIEGKDEQTFYMFDTTSGTGATATKVEGIVEAKMYGSSTDGASKFKYIVGGTLTDEEKQAGKAEIVSPVGEATNFTTKILALGEKYFEVKFENDFGYKGIVYCKIVAPINPQIINDGTVTLTERDTIAFGARYKEMTVPNIQQTEGDGKTYYYFSYNPFAYKAGDKIYVSDVRVFQGAGVSSELSVVIDGITYIRKIGTWTLNSLEDHSAYTEILKDAWKYTNGEASGEKTFEDAELAGKNITLTLKVAQGTAGELKGYKVWVRPNGAADEQKTYLTQTHSESSLFVNPIFEEKPTEGAGENKNKPSHGFVFSGLEAYGYSNEYGILDTNAATVSRVHEVYISKVELKYGNMTRELAKPTAFSGKGVSLITSSNYSFLDNKGTIKSGNGYSASIVEEAIAKTLYDWTVPYIDSAYFGTGDTLEGVRMVVTITDGTNDATVEQIVNIKRKESTAELFTSDSDTIVDNSTVTVKDTTKTELINDTLEFTLDPGESVTYKVKLVDKVGETTFMNDNYEGEAQTITNDKSYTKKFYRSITAGLSDKYYKRESGQIIFLNNDFANVYKKYSPPDIKQHFILTITEKDKIGKGVTVKYNGTSLNTQNTEDTSVKTVENAIEWANAFENYDNEKAITLNIEDVAELSGDSKNVTLFFMKKGTNDTEGVGNGTKYYRFAQNFSVVPKYKEAKYSDNNRIQVQEYTKITTADGKPIYTIDFSQWAKGIDLFDYVSKTGTGTKISTEVTNEASGNFRLFARKNFHFEIRTSDGVGSAYIDENGFITTTTDFNLNSHTISVTMYMKVSGANGLFEEENTTLRLGTMTLYLATSGATVTSLSSTGGAIYTSETNQGDLLVIEGSKAGLLKVEEGSTGWNPATNIGNVIEVGNLYAQVIPVGTTLNFKDKYVVSSSDYGNNIHDHETRVVRIEDTTNDSISYYNHDNKNAWTFDKVGNFKVVLLDSFIATKNGQTDIYYKYFYFEVVVYDTTNTEDRQAYLTVGESVEFNTTSSSDAWYLKKENGTIEKKTEFTADTAGIFTEQYIVITSNSSKVVNYTYYVSEDQTANEENFKKDIVVTSGGSYNIANALEGSSLQIYRLTTEGGVSLERVTREYFTNTGSNSTRDVKYFVKYTTKDETSGENLDHYNLYTFTYYVSADSFADHIVMAKGKVEGETTTPTAEAGTTENPNTIENLVLGAVGTVEGSAYEVYEINKTTGVLTKVGETDELVIDAKTHRQEKSYVVVEKVGSNTGVIKSIKKCNITFYVYQSEITLDYATAQNSAFRLSELTNAIKDNAGLADSNIESVLFYEIDENKDIISEPIEIINLQDDTREIYYIAITATKTTGETIDTTTTYHKLDVNFIIQSSELTA